MVFVGVCGSLVPPFFTADAGGKVRASKLGVGCGGYLQDINATGKLRKNETMGCC